MDDHLSYERLDEEADRLIRIIPEGKWIPLRDMPHIYSIGRLATITVIDRLVRQGRLEWRRSHACYGHYEYRRINVLDRIIEVID